MTFASQLRVYSERALNESIDKQWAVTREAVEQIKRRCLAKSKEGLTHVVFLDADSDNRTIRFTPAVVAELVSEENGFTVRTNTTDYFERPCSVVSWSPS